MNKNTYVEFKRKRDLGAIITDTFKFIRLEEKPFFTMVFKTAIVPILLAIAALLYYSYAASGTFTGIDFQNPGSNVNPFGNSGDLFLSIFLLFVFYIIAYAIINVAALYYIKSYIDNKGHVEYSYVRQKVKEKFWSFVGLGILIGIIVGISAFFCFFPAIYTGVVLSLATSIFVFQEKTVMDAISDSFSFIKNHWWETFGILLVVAILVTVLGYIFSIPVIIYELIQGFSILKNQDPTEVFNLFSDPIYLLFTVISYLGNFLFYSVTLISTVLIYFDINEQKNHSGTFEKIDDLGN